MTTEEREKAQQKAERSERAKINRLEKKYREETIRHLRCVENTAKALRSQIESGERNGTGLYANELFGDELVGGMRSGYAHKAEGAYKNWLAWKVKKRRRSAESETTPHLKEINFFKPRRKAMKPLKEILECPRLKVARTADDGGQGVVYFSKFHATVIWSDGAGWDHVSITPFNHKHTPTWEEMCKLKDIFFKPEETVLQFHPAKSQYVNQMANCLHLWRPQRIEVAVPPMILTGVWQAMSSEKLDYEFKLACESPYALTDKMVERGETAK